MKTFTIELSEQQLKIVQDAIDHLVEVDLGYMDYDEPTQEEAVLVQKLFKDAVPGIINSVGL